MRNLDLYGHSAAKHLTPQPPLLQARGRWLDKEDGLPSMKIIEGWYDNKAIWAELGFGICK